MNIKFVIILSTCSKSLFLFACEGQVGAVVVDGISLCGSHTYWMWMGPTRTLDHKLTLVAENKCL
jgi:hypothetical protein